MTTTDLLTLDTAEESTHVVTSLSALKLLVEHLDTGKGSLDGRTETDNLDVSTLGGDTTLNLERTCQ